MSKETLLIVDDNKEIVTVLSDALSIRGYNILSAFDGTEGLQTALDKSPDLLLLDWNLPGLSGIQVLQALRKQGNQAPVILMTIYGSESVAVQAFKLGIRDYLRKPVRLPEMLEAVEKALAEDRLRREKERISAELERANAQLQQQLLELATLQAIAQSITAVLDLDKVLDRVVEAACYFGHAQESALFLLDEPEDSLQLEAYHGAEQRRMRGLRLKFSTSPLRTAIDSGSPLMMTSKTPGFSIKLKTDYLVRSLLFVPLKIKDRPIGLLGVTDKLGGQPFSQEDIRLLTALADYAAIAIENARLYQSEKELARATAVKQLIVTLSHHIMNPLTAIKLCTYEMGARLEADKTAGDEAAFKHRLDLIEMNVQEIIAVMDIVQQIAAPRSVTYVGDIEMIDIEDEVRRRVEQIRADFGKMETWTPED